jgi:4-amino-4-deoxy-L-arabinose transferase-like glycosyltransferase
MGRRWFSPAAGWWAGLGWLLILQVLIHGQLCVADMALLFGITLAQWGALELLRHPPGTAIPRFNRWFWCMVAGFSLGFLAKGPVALIVPLLGWVMAWWPLRGGKFAFSRLQPFSLLLLVLLISGLWGIPALLKTDGLFFQKGIGEHVVERGIRAFNGRINIPGVYYLVTSLFVLLPWSALFPTLFRKKTADPLRRLLWGWFLAPFVVFSFYSTQLPHYVMPGFPAFMLLLFSAGAPARPQNRFETIWFYSLVVLVSLVVTGLAAGLLFLPLSDPMRDLKTLMAGALVFFAAILALMFLPGMKRPLLLLAPCILCLSAGGWLIGKGLKDTHPAFRSGSLATFRDDPSRLMVACRYTEPSLVYYADHPYQLTNREPEALQWLTTHEGAFTGVFLLQEWDLGKLLVNYLQGKELLPGQDRRAQVPLEGWPAGTTLKTVQGFNGAKFKWVEILVVEKPGAKE